MQHNMVKRIQAEVADANDDTVVETRVYVPDESNFYHMIASIPGPSDSVYENGIFLLDVKLNANHPFAPPEIKFITKVFHPNVSSQTGAICLDVLKSNWSPVMTIRICLVSIQSLLDSPDASSPQDYEVAKVYTRDREEFNQEARLWTNMYANVSLNDHVAAMLD